MSNKDLNKKFKCQETKNKNRIKISCKHDMYFINLKYVSTVF